MIASQLISFSLSLFHSLSVRFFGLSPQPLPPTLGNSSVGALKNRTERERERERNKERASERVCVCQHYHKGYFAKKCYIKFPPPRQSASSGAPQRTVDYGLCRAFPVRFKREGLFQTGTFAFCTSSVLNKTHQCCSNYSQG